MPYDRRLALGTQTNGADLPYGMPALNEIIDGFLDADENRLYDLGWMLLVPSKLVLVG